MDFGTLLSVAEKNETAKQTGACYQTKFAPPKKQTKQTKSLSDNIKKFLARREEEERQKALDEKKRRENLLALRDHKAQSRINKHLKVCKAANKSVLADAIDNENTAVTMAGPSQPDEDDYGYVSQEASAFYNQLMNKYSNVAPQKPIFSNSGKRTIKDIASTKDRVKQALKQQEVEETLGNRRKRKSSTLKKTETEAGDLEERPERRDDGNDKKEKEDKQKAKKRPMPPPIDFGELLKIAEKKQHEPVVIEVKPKNEEPERLMTKKQMKEYAKEKAWRERKEQREKTGETASKIPNTSSTVTSSKSKYAKIPKTSEKQNSAPSVSSKNHSKPPITTTSSYKKHSEGSSESKVNPSKSNVPKTTERDMILEERRKLEAEKRKLEEMRQAIEEERRKLAQSKSKPEDTKSYAKPVEKSISKTKAFEKQESSKYLKQRELPSAKSTGKTRLPVSDGRPKQFPPADRMTLKTQQAYRKLPSSNKSRRRFEDDEDDYDSELDDFIDDGPEEEGEDYSKYISEIFGYDKSKYRYNDNEDDDAAMESSFAQQLKEEYVSTKAGIMEDLEDIRMEALEKKRKALMKNKIKK